VRTLIAGTLGLPLVLVCWHRDACCCDLESVDSCRGDGSSSCLIVAIHGCAELASSENRSISRRKWKQQPFPPILTRYLKQRRVESLQRWHRSHSHRRLPTHLTPMDLSSIHQSDVRHQGRYGSETSRSKRSNQQSKASCCFFPLLHRRSRLMMDTDHVAATSQSNGYLFVE
jgi:hypothetical protein